MDFALQVQVDFCFFALLFSLVYATEISIASLLAKSYGKA